MLKSKKTLIILLIMMTLLMFMAFAFGCSAVKKIMPGRAGGGGPATSQAGEKPVTSPAEFQADYKQWTAQLEGIVERINSAYADWNDKKIDRSQFLDQLLQIQNDFNSLSQVTDFQVEFNLSSSDQQRVNYQAVVEAYLHVSKDVNDFLYYAPHHTDDKIRSDYENLIQNKYNSDMANLKNLEGSWR